jgi:hypothetical protein
MDNYIKTIRDFFSKEDLKMNNSLSVDLDNSQFQQVLELLPFSVQFQISFCAKYFPYLLNWPCASSYDQ